MATRKQTWISDERQAVTTFLQGVNALYVLKQEYAAGGYAAGIADTDFVAPNNDVTKPQMLDAVATADAIITFLGTNQYFGKLVAFRKP